MEPTSDTIRVLCRIRPSKRPSGYFSPDPATGVLSFHVPPDLSRDVTNNAGATHAYKFGAIFDGQATQEEVFDAVAKDAVDSCLSGFNSTVFAYGQTGSGKTFTITGGAERYADRGIIPRCLQRVFAAVKESTKVSYTVRVSYMEIYNENAYDLLDSTQETKSLEELPRVTLMEDEEGQVHLRGLSQHPASSEEDALNMLFLGDTNRAIAETPLNLASSRSHCLFTVSLEAVEEGSSIIRRSKLHLVDLAGSERTGKTQSTGTLFREATHINKSLHYLELVIVALHEARKGGPGRSHIPYRNSLMTSVLRDSLGGNCKTTMIATINPEGEHTDESISTCRFAQRVARITNCAVVNEALDPVVLSKQLKVRVSSLEAELALARGLEVGEGGSVQPPMTEEERAAAVAAARAWVGASDAQGQGQQGQQQLELGSPPTMERIRLALDTCKVCAQEYRSLAESAAAAQQAQAAAAPTQQQQQQPPHTPSRSASSSGGGDSELLSALREEVARLSSRLAQRDREVGALVARLEGGSSSSGSGGGGGRVAKSGSVVGGAAPTPPPPQPPPTLQIHLPPLPDGTPTPPLLLDDQDLALEAFRSRHASRDSMEDNKALLRAKYDSARNEAERVNACRARMGSLKEEIDRLRMARAVGALEGGSASSSSSSSSSEGGGAGSGEGERELLAALEGEKGAYKAAFNALRTQKGEIEQIQRLLEGARVRLEAEFQAWLSDCKAARVAAAAAVTLPASLASTPASSVPSSPARGAVSAGSRLPVAAAGGAGAGAGGASAGPGSNNTSMLGGLLASTIGGGLPGGSAAIPPRTSVSAPGKVVGGGSSGDVEDDIAAFYKLKAAAGSKK